MLFFLSHHLPRKTEKASRGPDRSRPTKDCRIECLRKTSVLRHHLLVSKSVAVKGPKIQLFVPVLLLPISALAT